MTRPAAKEIRERLNKRAPAGCSALSVQSGMMVADVKDPQLQSLLAREVGPKTHNQGASRHKNARRSSTICTRTETC